ncbi:hypothetical protein LTR85_008377 [Meristemomyces frigidus]|nr:hypothetical protein LTR85_008377 [Meristemomyces frigidus]
MDPALQAAYEQGFASATARHGPGPPRMISATASALGAAVKPTSTPSDLRQIADSNSMGIGTFIRSLLFILWRIVASISHFFWIWLIRPLLLCGLAAGAILLLINVFRITDWLAEKGEDFRDWYDDFALNNEILLNIERSWASFKRAMVGLGLMLRYNWYTDQLRLLRQEIRLGFDRVMGHWRKILLGLAVMAWATSRVKKAFTPMVAVGWPGFDNLPTQLQPKAPAWVYTPRKYEGSNSHYTPEREQPEVVPWEEWVKGFGSDQSVRLEPHVETMVITHTEYINAHDEDSSVSLEPRSETVTFTQTERRYTYVNARATAADLKLDITETETEISSITHTRRVAQTTSVAEEEEEEAEDYWAPPKGRTVILSEESVWCRECQQFHCCELPY